MTFTVMIMTARTARYRPLGPMRADGGRTQGAGPLRLHAKGGVRTDAHEWNPSGAGSVPVYPSSISASSSSRDETSSLR